MRLYVVNKQRNKFYIRRKKNRLQNVAIDALVGISHKTD